MSDVAEDIRARAKLLTPEQRRELALELLDADLDPEIEQAWIEEVQRRSEELRSGEVEALTTEALLARLASDE